MLITKNLYYTNNIFVSQLRNILKNNVKNYFLKNNDILAKISFTKNFKQAFFFLNKHSLCSYKQLIDIITYDMPSNKYRFTINYNLLSILYTTKLIISIKTNELKEIYSLSSIYRSAVWLEREVWDLYGIFFFENTDLRRILTDYGFTGHPLRKDFPLTGFIEVYYSYENHIVMYDQAELSQELRVFTLEN